MTPDAIQQRALLHDAARIFAGLVSDSGSYPYSDIRDWVRTYARVIKADGHGSDRAKGVK